MRGRVGFGTAASGTAASEMASYRLGDGSLHGSDSAADGKKLLDGGGEFARGRGVDAVRVDQQLTQPMRRGREGERERERERKREIERERERERDREKERKGETLVEEETSYLNRKHLLKTTSPRYPDP